MIKIIKVKDYADMSVQAAELILAKVLAKPNLILGLATGGTAEGMYAELVKAYKAQKGDWSEVRSFNLDEYLHLNPSSPLSYHFYMQDKFFQHVNLKPENTYLPDGQGDPQLVGPAYDQLIAKLGGIDLQILGLGENAHIGFNEPGSSPTAGTHKVALTASTIAANARYFTAQKDVPKFAITMGIGTILQAREILLLASGRKKAQAIHDLVKGPITPQVPASFLQNHLHVTLIIDEEAASLL